MPAASRSRSLAVGGALPGRAVSCGQFSRPKNAEDVLTTERGLLAEPCEEPRRRVSLESTTIGSVHGDARNNDISRSGELC